MNIKKIFKLILVLAIISTAFAIAEEIKIAKNPPEKYIKKPLIKIRRQQMEKMEKEDGTNIFYVSKPLPSEELFKFGIDGNGNIYILFRDAVRIFDKNSNFIRRIPLNGLQLKRGNSISVDKDGSFLIFDDFDVDENVYLYKKDGSFFRHFSLGKAHDRNNFGLLKGTIYSKDTGKSFFSIKKNEIKQTMFLNDFWPNDENRIVYKKDKNLLFPIEIEEHQVLYVDGIDVLNNIYVFTEKTIGKNGEDKYGKPKYVEDYWIYKFDPALNLLARINVGLPLDSVGFIDSQTGNVFAAEIDENNYSFVEWQRN